MTARFKPGLSLTVCVLIAVAILLTLGTWQARKVRPKTEFLQTLEANMSAPAVPLDTILNEPQSYLYRHISFFGIRTADPIKLFGTNRKGESGYYLYAPVKTTGGLVVIANFGWIPLHMKEAPSLPSGEALYEGVVLASAKPGSMTPVNDPDAGNWYLADVTEMALHFGYSENTVFPLRLFLDDKAGSLPLGGQVRLDIPNNHLQYAFTWYGLALALVGVYIVFGFKRGGSAP